MNVFGTMEEVKEKMRKANQEAELPGPTKAYARMKEQGRLNARERIDVLLDPGTFVELGRLAESTIHEFGMDKKRLPGDGIIIGHGKIDGRMVCVYSQDSAVLGGSVGVFHGRMMCEITDLATKTGVPIINLMDSPGARIQEAIGEVQGPPDIFYRNVRASGVVPQLSLVFGNVAGLVIYSAALTDFIFMVEEQSHALITGPEVIRTISGEEITMEDLAGARVHAEKTGIADYVGKDDVDLLLAARRFISFLPGNNLEGPPKVDTGDSPTRRMDEVDGIVPVDPGLAFDVHDVIDLFVDSGDFFEIEPDFASELVTGFGRLAGSTVGILANNPLHLAGSLTVDSSDKFARFMRFCDAFNIPCILFVDVPGYFPGIDQEHRGIINHGAKVLYALCEATVPKISVVIRKCYGGGMLAMGGHKALRIDQAFGWPTAELATMGADAAVNVLYREELKNAADPDARRSELLEEYREEHANPVRAANKRFLDDVIDPGETRLRVIAALELLSRKKDDPPPQKKHGNIPL
jgi:acetyl-CoA/propionyl-CoA carboxylase carboxyl transferase subunit